MIDAQHDEMPGAFSDQPELHVPRAAGSKVDSFVVLERRS
ncbi:hypothetical protein BVRB_3g062700 [Beta vulgaris subsp. vulgaris]|nr:hypothetical protein BVRB_3g062700 [Beta vulgaris subsp. vulgaris]